MSAHKYRIEQLSPDCPEYDIEAMISLLGQLTTRELDLSKACADRFENAGSSWPALKMVG